MADAVGATPKETEAVTPDEAITAAHEQMADPSYWAGFKGGIDCMYCGVPLTERNGTRRPLDLSEPPVYELLCVACLIGNAHAEATDAG